jgi:hypothetical protein
LYQRRWDAHHHQQLLQARCGFDDGLDDTLNCTTPTQHTSTAESPLHDDAAPAHQREPVDTAPPFHPAHCNQRLLQSPLTFPRTNTPSPKHNSHCTPTPTRDSTTDPRSYLSFHNPFAIDSDSGPSFIQAAPEKGTRHASRCRCLTTTLTAALEAPADPFSDRDASRCIQPSWPHGSHRSIC